MPEVTPDENTCQVCGEQCAVVPGTFELPDGVSGQCCGLCGPKVEQFIESMDLRDLPEGPLRAFLKAKNDATNAQMLMQLMSWLSMMHGTIVFAPGRAKVSCPIPGRPSESYNYEDEYLIPALQGLYQFVQAKTGAPN